MSDETCAWCGRFHDDVRTFGDDACDLSLAVTRFIALVRRPAFRVLTKLTRRG
jgi:hypothetical protein